ncbi:MAG: dTDP-glucose 4,6-dehydratase [Patescibacteria group bacterium]|nr:dTDP-glucose 4,6-dehydratase [Patescibacteria group bacterium]MDD4304304.1 dTDP-glucose 4,6-dehydratase [Patescibacteria group bacterium]MDD4695669.1 dTDP-glucose 4,6-dehydratase [Patescibacteria group bacterium]
MKIFITGGAGFIGTNFIYYMMKKYPDYKIVNFDKLTYAGNLNNLKSIENNPNYKFIKGDIAEENDVKNAMTGCDTVVHFAAESHVDRSIMDPDTFVRTNILGTNVLLRIAKELRINRFHHVSTDEVFGALKPNDSKFNEDTIYDPKSPYSASKAASDHLVRAYYHTFALPITISNCSNNYGPYQFPEKFIPLFATNLIEGKKVPVYGEGLNIRDWIHVDDHSSAVDLILHNGKIGSTYCIGADCEKTNIDIVHLILKHFGKDEEMIEYVQDRLGHDFRYAIDSSKIQNELGWKPQISFEDGLKQTLKWYEDNEYWWREIKSGDYQKYYENQYVNRK